jgi:hypothetical protein
MEIPASLLQKLLNDADKIGNNLCLSLSNIQEKKDEFRNQLTNNRVILLDSEIECTKSYSTCGIDGACAIERLIGTDLVVAGAVGVEGLYSELDQSLWKNPDNEVFVNAEIHDPENMIIARALMLQMELKLATNAPHDLVLMDGSLTTALIHMYKAMDHFQKGISQSVNKLRNDFVDFLMSYRKILGIENNDKIWIGIPKYTSRNDIATKLNWNTPYDDKAVLSLVLNPGEYTQPMLFTDKDAWHVKVPYEDKTIRVLMQEIVKGIRQLSVLYYKPHSWSPALRIEVPSGVAQNHEKLSAVLENIKIQCKSPSLMEPYPLYMADRIVKNIGQAIPSYRQIVTRKMVEGKKVNSDNVFFMMHSYRTESN